MKPLPQRRKSAEEIAKLRETLGISPPSAEPATGESPPAAAAPPPSPPPPAPPPSSTAPAPEPAAILLDPEPRLEPRAPAAPKRVRSLRKSEQAAPVRRAAPRPAPAGPSKIPTRRHSEREIMDLRRREASPGPSPAETLRKLTGHPAVITTGYLAAISAALAAWQLNTPVPAAVLTAAALASAAFLGLRKIRSRHHASFIFLIALFTAVFGYLHHFPTTIAEEPPPPDPTQPSRLLSVDDAPSSLTDEERALILELNERSRPIPAPLPRRHTPTPPPPPDSESLPPENPDAP
jgi:hypothetical protein